MWAGLSAPQQYPNIATVGHWDFLKYLVCLDIEDLLLNFIRLALMLKQLLLFRYDTCCSKLLSAVSSEPGWTSQ